tara:strand:- start:797 stop:925 length:129 start_codon:yes stop_codon:yes gene_type:complete
MTATEQKYINQFINRIENNWIEDLSWVDVDTKEFCTDNRKYI